MAAVPPDAGGPAPSGQWAAPPPPWPPAPPGWGYGLPPPGWQYPPPAPPATSGLSVASLVLGIVPFIPVVGSIVAIVLGLAARQQIAASAGRLRGAGMALAGIVLGAVEGVALCLLGVALAVGVFVTPATPSAGSRTVPTGAGSGLGPMVVASPGLPGAEGVAIPDGPPLADVSSAATGQPVEGVQCQADESLTYHIHTHLSVYVNGQDRQIPAFISINGGRLYWLHTHVADGVIHVESPTARLYTLGDFFDLWGQPLSPTQVGPVTGRLTVFFDGRLFTGSDPRAIPLEAHGQIQIDVGQPLVVPLATNFGEVR